MEVTSTKAELVAKGDVEAQPRLSVTLPRSEVEAALAEAEPPELVLDVAYATGEERDVERRKISVEWDAADIQQLLNQTPGDAITFSFKQDELERIMSEDVELHGLRDKALVLSVVVGVAAGGASSALAMPDTPTGPTSRGAAVASVSHDEQTLQQRGIETVAPSQRDEATLAERGIQPAAVSERDEATLAERGIQPAVVSQPDEATLAERGIQPSVVSQPDEATLADRGIDPTVVPRPDEATLAQRGVPDSVVAQHDEASLADRGIQTPAVSAPETASASDSPTLDPSTAAALGIAGGVGLLILGAAFVARRQRPVQPT
jgi:MYXO-CTERM domain-containing protein